MRAIYILWLRQLKRYARSKSRIIGTLAQPMLYLVAFGFGFGSIYQKAGGGSYIQFLAPGIISMSVLFMSIFFGIEVIWDRQFGFLKETMVAPVSRFKIMLGRTLGGATVATIQGIIVFGLSMLVGFRPTSWALAPLAIIFIFLLSMLFTAIGTGIASVLDDMHGFQLIMNFLVMPIFLLSGALFPLDNAPKILRIISNFDPLSYGVDGIRGVLSNVHYFGIYHDLAVLSVLVVVFLGIGAWLFNQIEV